jgi:hypothetical protein
MYNKDLESSAPVAPVGPLNNALAVDQQKPVDKPVANNQTINNPMDNSQPLNSKQIKELALWSQIASRCYRKDKGKAIDFECKALSDEMANEIRENLRKAKTGDEVLKAFEVKNFSSKEEQIIRMLELNLKSIEK